MPRGFRGMLALAAAPAAVLLTLGLVAALGTVVWQTDGVSLCVASNDQQGWPYIVSDDDWGAIVAWRDYRSGSNWDIYAQRVRGAAEINLPLVMRKYPG